MVRTRSNISGKTQETSTKDMKRSKKAKPNAPRRGISQTERADNPSVPENTGDPATIIMDPVPISQVPFQEIQERRASSDGDPPSPGNPNHLLVEDEEMVHSVPTAAELRENLIIEQIDEICPTIEQIGALNSSPSDRIEKNIHDLSNEERETEIPTEAPKIDFQPSLLNTEHITAPSVETMLPTPSGKTLRKRKRVDPFEGADPRAKRPNDFPISARPPREKLEDNEQITEALVNSQMLGTVTNIEPYEENVIYEFYSNLGTGTTTPSDPMYGKVYLRGNFYNFTPALINKYMSTSPREEEAEATSEQVAQELTAGNVSFEKNKIKAASLTSKYAILQKIALVNWMPSLHENTVKWSLAELLYKIGKGIKVNFGELVHSQIMNVIESGMPKASLIFPNLIHTLLVQQKFKHQRPTVPVKPLSISVKLRKGTHQNDLKTTTPKENPTDKTTLLKYFQKRLTEIEQEESWISKRHLELKEEKSEDTLVLMNTDEAPLNSNGSFMKKYRRIN
nr:uncharacterized protein LOC109178478 [Ipomoea trifida]